MTCSVIRFVGFATLKEKLLSMEELDDGRGGGGGGGGDGSSGLEDDGVSRKRTKQTELSMIQAFGCGAVVGALSVPATHPIDVIKTNMMAYKGPVKSLQPKIKHTTRWHLVVLRLMGCHETQGEAFREHLFGIGCKLPLSVVLTVVLTPICMTSCYTFNNIGHMLLRHSGACSPLVWPSSGQRVHAPFSKE